MRQPPRQPPRQAPKPARGGGARKPPAQRNKAPARRPPQQKPGPGAKGGKVPPLTDAQRKSMQHQRYTYWGLHGEEKETLYNQQHAAGGEAIGTVLNADRRARWKTSFAIGAITFLIISGFTGAMAFGAESFAIGLIAFICLAISVGFVTAEYSQRHFPQPIRHAPLAQHRLEDLIFEDDPTPRPTPPVDKSEVNSMSDLENAFTHADQKTAPATAPSAASASAATAPQRPEAPTGSPTAVAQSTTTEPAEAEVEVLGGAGIRLEPDSSAEPSPEVETAPEVNKPSEPVAAASEAPESAIVAASGPSEEATVVAAAEAEALTDQKNAGDSPPLGSAPPPPSSPGAVEPPAMPAGAAELGITDVRDVAATLVVGDLDKSVEFYTQNLRLSVVDRTSEAALLEAGFGRILLWQRDDAPAEAQGIMHLTFEVGNLEATYRTMRDNGVNFSGAPTEALEGENFQLRAAAFSDPDGHGLAITERQDSEDT